MKFVERIKEFFSTEEPPGHVRTVPPAQFIPDHRPCDIPVTERQTRIEKGCVGHNPLPDVLPPRPPAPKPQSPQFIPGTQPRTLAEAGAGVIPPIKPPIKADVSMEIWFDVLRNELEISFSTAIEAGMPKWLAVDLLRECFSRAVIQATMLK